MKKAERLHKCSYCGQFHLQGILKRGDKVRYLGTAILAARADAKAMVRGHKNGYLVLRWVRRGKNKKLVRNQLDGCYDGSNFVKVK